MLNTARNVGFLAKAWLFVLGAVIVAAGLFFTIGGGKLVLLGGSLYFIICGLALLVSGFLIARRNPSGALIFGLIFVLSMAWAVWEVGLTFWPLNSRLLALGVGASVVAFSYPLLRRSAGLSPAQGPSFAVAAVLALASIGGMAGMFVPHPPVAFSGTPDALTKVDPAHEQKNWEAYGNTSGGSRFVALDQITRDNISGLKVAWTYHTGDTPISPGNNGAEDQQTPLQVGDRVTHDTYGLGTVVVVEGAGRNAVAKIDFGADGVKRLLLRYSPVEKL